VYKRQVSEWGDNGNFTFTLTDAPYCAVLSDTSCSNNVSLGSAGVVKTRLGNTKGFWLEAQDCNVFVTSGGGDVVKTYDTMMYSQDTDLTVDDDGNWITRADKKVPLTDSLGYYVYSFKVDRDWARYDEEYTIHVICNGQETTCNFNASKVRLPDTGEVKAITKEGGGLITGVLLLILLVFLYFKYLHKQASIS